MSFGNRGNSFSRGSSTFGGFGRSRIALNLGNHENKKKESNSFKPCNNTNSFFKTSNNFHDSNSNDYINNWGDVNFNNEDMNGSVFVPNKFSNEANTFSQRLEDSAFNNQSSINSNISSSRCLNDDRKPHFLNNYIPKIRDLEDLYKEDADQAEYYRQISYEDDEIHISGQNVECQVVLDSWENSGFGSKLLQNIIDRSKYVHPRKIQSHVIPIVLEGRDLKGHAETGSGKTASFMLPIIHMLMQNKNSSQVLGSPSPYAIIMEPTRELCSQVYEQGRKLANETSVSVAKAYGQYNMRENLLELQTGCDILCATPGRLKHLIQSKFIFLDNLKFFVFDEADSLLETNFLNDIREIINQPNFPDKEHRQTMLFSATFPELVQKLSLDVLKDDCVMVSNRKMVAANSKVMQHFVLVESRNKKQTLIDILEKEMQEAKNKDSLNPPLRRTLVFVRTKRDADLVSLFLCEKGISATTINGDRTQALREKALRDFKNNDVYVLVSTDVCARGIDIKDLDHVINMDLPNDAVTYVHRIGRTGRLKPGLATSFFDRLETNDCNIAKKLVEFVQNAGQVAPDFLIKASNEYDSFDSNYTYKNNNQTSGW